MVEYSAPRYLEIVYGLPGMNASFDRDLRNTSKELANIVRAQRGIVDHIKKGVKANGSPDYVSDSDYACQKLLLRHFHETVSNNGKQSEKSLYFSLGKVFEEEDLKIECSIDFSHIDCPWDSIDIVADPICGSSENRRRNANVFCNTCIAFRNKETGLYEVPGFCSINAITGEMVWSKPGSSKIWYRFENEFLLLSDPKAVVRNKPLASSKVSVREATHKYTPAAQKLFMRKGRLFNGTIEGHGSVMANTWELMKGNCGALIMTPYGFDKESDEIVMDGDKPKLREPKPWDVMNTSAHEFKAGYVAYDILPDGFRPVAPLFSMKPKMEFERLVFHKTRIPEFELWVIRNGLKLYQ